MPYKDPEKRKEQKKQWAEDNKEYYQEYRKKYKKKNPEYMRGYHLKRKYGMCQEDYNKIYDQQNGKCIGCEDDIIHNGKLTHIDHCHNTGIVRGLLCSKCNQLIGLAKENIKTLNNIINYLTGPHSIGATTVIKTPT